MNPKDFLYGRKGPWPQPCPDHPYDESPAVIHLPLIEWIDWWLRIGLRFMILWPLLTPWYYLKGFLNPGLKKVEDKEFNDLLTNSMMSRFIHEDLDETDLLVFKDRIVEGEKYFVVDLEALRVVVPFKNMHVTPSKTLLKEISHHHYEVVCIWIDKTNEIFTSDDGDAWELAKYFVLQGGALCATMVVHPLQHFPLDSINAITKTALPRKHTLFKLLHAHMRFTLPLENAVLNFEMSLLHHDRWWKTYAPFPGPYDGIRDLLVEGYRGIEGNNSYPAFSYPRRPPIIHSEYGTFLDAYYEVIYQFVDTVVGTIEENDIYVKNWADYISGWIPGFPDGVEIFKNKTLTEVVAFYIWDVTVGHTIDHHNYATMDIRKVPLRIRQAPPVKGVKMKPLNKLQTPIDLMKYQLAMKLFFGPSVITRLVDVEYGFSESELQTAVTDFKHELKRVDAEMKERGICFVGVEDIARSIQF